MSEGLDNLLNSTGKILKTVPEVYNDLAQPTAKESGKLLSLIPRTINAAFAPLECWIEERMYRVDETKKLLAIKLEHVGEEKIVTPDPYVAIPALQAISYSMDSEELRNLYANLLAKAMNVDTKDNVHPSYVETIKQLSPADAAYFKKIYSLNTRPIVEIRLVNNSFEIYTISKLVNTFSTGFDKTYYLNIDNLSRLGLINIPVGSYYGDDNLYNSLINKLKELYPLEKYIPQYPDAVKVDFQKQRIDITEYGNLFFNICVN